MVFLLFSGLGVGRGVVMVVSAKAFRVPPPHVLAHTQEVVTAKERPTQGWVFLEESGQDIIFPGTKMDQRFYFFSQKEHY